MIEVLHFSSLNSSSYIEKEKKKYENRYNWQFYLNNMINAKMEKKTENQKQDSTK